MQSQNIVQPPKNQAKLLIQVSSGCPMIVLAIVNSDVEQRALIQQVRAAVTNGDLMAAVEDL